MREIYTGESARRLDEEETACKSCKLAGNCELQEKYSGKHIAECPRKEDKGGRRR